MGNSSVGTRDFWVYPCLTSKRGHLRVAPILLSLIVSLHFVSPKHLAKVDTMSETNQIDAPQKDNRTEFIKESGQKDSTQGSPLKIEDPKDSQIGNPVRKDGGSQPQNESQTV